MEKEKISETQITAPTEPQNQESRFKKALSKRYPDRTFESDDQAQDAFLEDYELIASKLDDNEITNKRMYELIEANPALADIIVEMDNGTPFEVALASHVDLQAIAPQNGEPNFEAYQNALKERKERILQAEKHKEQIEAAQAKSKADADEFFAQIGMDEAEQKEFVDFVEGFIDGLFKGEVSKVTLSKMYQAFKYDEAVAAAQTQGQINGRNELIEAKRTKNGATDGIPSGGSSIENSQEANPTGGNDMIASIAARSAARKKF